MPPLKFLRSCYWSSWVVPIRQSYYVNWACITSPPPPGTLADGVRELIELQVHSRAAWEVGEALSLSNVVLHFLQVGEERCLLRRSTGEFGLLHGDGDWTLLQCPLSHAERLRKENRNVNFSGLTFPFQLWKNKAQSFLISLHFQILNTVNTWITRDHVTLSGYLKLR